MSEEFIQFLILQVLERGAFYQLETEGGWEERVPADVAQVALAQIRLARVEEIAQQEPGVQKLLAIEAEGRGGERYGGHLVSDWDALLQLFSQTLLFTIENGRLVRSTP